MKEIETKLLGLSYKDVKKAFKNLKSYEFFLTFDGNLTDTYYKRGDEMVRFRLWKDQYGESQLDVTLKGLKEKTKYPGIKKVEEVELHDISDDSSIEVLKLMGFYRFSTLRKRRRSYILKDRVRIDCDEVAGTKWVEIEGNSEEAVIDVVIALGHRPTECCDTPTWKLLLESATKSLTTKQTSV